MGRVRARLTRLTRRRARPAAPEARGGHPPTDEPIVDHAGSLADDVPESAQGRVRSGALSPLPVGLQRFVAYAVALLVGLVLVWVAGQVIVRIRTVVFAVVGALLLAALVAPLAAALRRWRVPDWLAALIATLLVVGVLVGSVYLVVDRAVSQVGDLQQAMTDAIHRLEQSLLDSSLHVSPARLEQTEARLVGFVRGAVPSPAAGATMVIDVLVGALLGAFLLFFFVRDGERMWRWVVRWTPPARAAQIDAAGRSAWQVLSGYAHGTVAVAFIDSVGIGAGMFALGVPIAASLTLVVFIGAFVPIVGALVSGVLAVGLTFVLVGPLQAAILLGVVVVVQQVEGNLLQPLIMGRVLRLHPVVIVLAVTIGTIVGGILGAIVAVPLVAVTYRLIEETSAPERRAARAADD